MARLSGYSSVVLFALLSCLFAARLQVVQIFCSWEALKSIKFPFAANFSWSEHLCEIEPSISPQPECAVSAGADCQYGHVEEHNSNLFPMLHKVTKTAYFRYFKVNLFCDCPLWPEDGMCAMKACSVCECDENEVPPAWIGDDAHYCNSRLKKVSEESTVDRSLNIPQQELTKLIGWAGLDNPWLPDADSDVEYSYINLLVNPERFTGYQGEHAHRIWNAIYSQNCFKNVHTEECDEESLVFYRIISGVHTSISMHLAREYLLDEYSDQWGTNLEVFKQRMADPSKCDHVRNLYFTYLFVVQAISRAAPAIEQVHYHTGMPDEDNQTQELMKSILESKMVSESCNLPFDIGRMWKGERGPQLKSEFQQHFQNITSIMDCVGCEKCKLWGKLQFLGVATALKILFASDDCFKSGMKPRQMLEKLQLERNEIIALVNLIAKLSQSIETYRKLSNQLEKEEGTVPCISPFDMLS